VSTVAVALPTQELVLGRYRPVRPLGSGGNGSVWLARDEHHGLEVALKIIPREGKGAARAEREALAARRLRHERCVRAYDVGHDSSHVYIAYEYVPGRTVREALQADALSDRDAVEIAAQVLDALAHAHRAGIVHRDVKPSNVLLENRDEVAARLLDFGLAQFDGADTLTAVGDVPGTLAYIAPERLAGAEATAGSDVWSVGVLLWEALSERHPFWGMPLQEVARAIEAGAPPLASERPDLPRRLHAAVDRALARDPEARPRASELATELRNALAPPERQVRRPTETVRPLPSAVPFSHAADLALSAGLAGVTAAFGATLLPFWPSGLVVAIVLAAALAGAVRPRIGLAIALAAPVFPLGNEAQSAAVLYGAFALGWLALSWSDARRGFLFAVGPLLAPLGALTLVPLAVQPARGLARKGAHAALALFAAALVAGTHGQALGFRGDETTRLGITPLDSVGRVALSLRDALASAPGLLGAALVLAVAAASLPLVRARFRYGVAAVGVALVAASLAAGVWLASVPLVIAVWAVAAALAARAPR